LDSATGEISPPVFPLELTWLERSGVPSDGRFEVLARDDLVFVLRELLKRPSGTTRSFKTGISSTVPRLSTVAWVKYAATPVRRGSRGTGVEETHLDATCV
jgi:hypothetical protein